MISKRMVRAGFRPARTFQNVRSIAAALGFAAIAVSAPGAPAAAAASVAAPRPARPDTGITDFYRARAGQPLWLSQRSGYAAQQLLQLIATSDIDGLDPRRYNAARIGLALRDAQRGDIRAINRAESMLSEAFVAFARDLRRAPAGVGVYYVDPDLAPRPGNARALLDSAAAASSLERFVREMGWMNPIYGQLRNAIVSANYSSDAERQVLGINLERARALPAGNQRYVLVNTAAQRLFMYENGQPVDSMRVVVGKPKYPTPMMAAYIRFASLNPYWFVPPDLAAERIAPSAAKRGAKYLNELGYQVLSDWGDNPTIVDPGTVDWKAVAEGRTEVRIRQLPGARNSMGRMKFMFPNQAGIYLHDNPERELFSEASRLYSGGCVRLEDADRLGQWLFGRPLVWQGAGTEEKVSLADPVPVYITYLTAMPSGATVAFYDDVYGRDGSRLAVLDGGRLAGK